MDEPWAPGPREQLAFLHALWRVLAEGRFTSTYKFALLHAIADLCLLRGDESGAELELDIREIAEQFIRLYWPGLAPCPPAPGVLGRGGGRVPIQITGGQAAVARVLEGAHGRFQGSLARLERDEEEWARVVKQVARTIQKMPLGRLQTVEGQRLEFLYRDAQAGDVVFLLPGVAHHMRAFYPMISAVVQGAWSRFVERRNPEIARSLDVRSHLFRGRDPSLAASLPLLRDVQAGRCLYCDRDIGGEGRVDRFVPWRGYALDLGHNFILAHPGCVRDRSGLLAAERHVVRWVGRNRDLGGLLERGFDARAIRHDGPATREIARWAYGRVHRLKGLVWVRRGIRARLGDEWRASLSPTGSG